MPAAAERQLALRAASHLVTTKGVDVLGAAVVARAAGLPESTVRWHFPSVDKMVRGLLHELDAAESRMLAAVCATRPRPTAEDTARAFTDSLLPALSRSQAMLAVHLQAGAARHAVLVEHFTEQHRRRVDNLDSWLAAVAGRRSGDPRVSAVAVDLAQLVDAVTSMIVPSREPVASPWVRGCASGLLRGLLPPSPLRRVPPLAQR